jgi:hypothetical protein
LDEYESSLAKQIEEDIDYDQKSVWSIINKRKKKPSICNALKKGDSVFTDPNDVSMTASFVVFKACTNFTHI